MEFLRIKSLDDILANAEKKPLKRQLDAFHLIMLGIGAVIGTGIFVLTSVAADKAGPGMLYSFIISGIVCMLTALIYAEIASMVPVSGSAYTYAVLGEIVAWMVGWALILEYAVAAGAVSVGWSGYMNGILRDSGFGLPLALTAGPADTITLADGTTASGGFNLLAFLVALLVTWLLVIGTSKSAKFTGVLVIIKIVALTAFILLAFPAVQSANFEPMMPNGWGTPLSGVGVFGAAASIFFAYVGFDAVSTAAEETKDPQRNIPIGLIGSLLICTVFYLLVAYAAVGAMGAQPGGALSQSREPLAFILRELGYPAIGNAVALAAVLALPSVVLMMIYGQTRILFNMARDGLVPPVLAKVRCGGGIVRSDFPGGNAGRYFQLRHLVRVPDSGGGCDGVAQGQSAARAPFQNAAHLAGRAAGRRWLFAAVRQPGSVYDQAVLCMGCHWSGRVLRLQSPQQSPRSAHPGRYQRELS